MGPVFISWYQIWSKCAFNQPPTVMISIIYNLIGFSIFTCTLIFYCWTYLYIFDVVFMEIMNVFLRYEESLTLWSLWIYQKYHLMSLERGWVINGCKTWNYLYCSSDGRKQSNRDTVLAGKVASGIPKWFHMDLLCHHYWSQIFTHSIIPR